MTRFRSLLIFGLITLVAGGYLAAQGSRGSRSVRSSIQAATLISITKSRFAAACLCTAGCAASAMRSTRPAIAVPSLIAYMANGAADEALFQVIRRGVPGTEMPQSNRPDHEILQIIAYLRNMGAVAPAESAPAGNVANGEQLFAKQCQNCHRVAGKGGRLGPDLSRVGVGAHAGRDGARDSYAARMDPARLRDRDRRDEGRTEDSRREEERGRVLDSGDGYARTHPGISEIERRK